MHRQAIHRGRVAYEPNSLGGGCPFQAGMKGFTSFPQPIARATRCAASRRSSPTTTPRRRCSSNSQTRGREGAHHPRVPLRADQGADARDARAHRVACSRTSPTSSRKAWPKASASRCPEPHAEGARTARRSPRWSTSKALSLFARPGDGGIRTRRVAILVADGVDGEAAATLHEGLAEGRRGAALRRRAPGPGRDRAGRGARSRSHAGDRAVGALRRGGGARRASRPSKALATVGHAVEFIKDSYRHCKPILVDRRRGELCSRARAPRPTSPPASRIRACSSSTKARPRRRCANSSRAIAKHRHFAREMDPPLV